MKKKLSLFLVAFIAMAAYAVQFAVNTTSSVTELTVIKEATVWDFSKDVSGEKQYTTDDDKATEHIYANITELTYQESFNAEALAFTGEYPFRSDKKKFAQNGTLHFKTSVPGKIIVKFSDTGSSASATAVKRYLVVNGEQTDYWASRENNGDEPYAAQLNVTTDEIAVPAGDVTITGTAALVFSYISFTPSEEPQPAEASYYVVGTMNDWQASDEYKLATNAATEGEYMTTLQLAKDDEFKVIKVEGETTTWYPDGMDNNLKVEVSGEYDIYFRPDGQGGQDWHDGYIYLALKEEPLKEYTVQFVNGADWQQVYAYTWTGDGVSSEKVEQLGAWAGTEMGLIDTEAEIDGKKYPVYELKFKAAVEPANIIFSNGRGGEAGVTQTADQEFFDGYRYQLIIDDTPEVETYFEKVTDTKDITDGKYLIVYEGNDTHDAVAFNGGLTPKLDIASNGIAVTITEGIIAYTDALGAAVFTIDATAGTLKAANGNYVGVNSYGNGLAESESADAYTHAFSIAEDESFVDGITFEGGTVTMRYNYAKDQLRFRYYKSGQQAIALYKQIGEGGGGGDKTYTATFKTNLGWKPVYAYAWSGEGEAVEEFLGEWPGTEMTPADELDNGYGINFTAAEAPAFIIFNDGTKEGAVEGVNKTADLAFENGKAYSLIDNSIKTIAQLNALANKTEFTFTGKAIVVAKMEGESSQTIDNYIYIKDETGSSLIYDKGGAHSNESDKTKGLLVGDVITAPWNGTVSIYKNLFEVRPAGDEQLTASENVGEVTYPEATPGDVKAENVNQVVEIKGLTIYYVDGKNIKFTIGDALVNGWNQFGIELPEVTEGKTFDVVGAISIYGENIQFQPFTITEVVAPVEDVYSVAGSSEALFGTAWDASNEKNDMVKGEDNIFRINYEDVELEAGDIQLKVVKNHSWDTAYPAENYTILVPNAGKYNLTVTFNPETSEVGAELTSNEEPQAFSVSFTTDKEWKQVYAYVWKANIQAPVEWPGVEITESLKEGVYTYAFEAAEAPDFIIFNDGTKDGSVVGTNQTTDLPFENGAAYTLTTEKTTAWVGDPEEAISATTGITISAKTCVEAGVQEDKVVRIVAKELAAAAPARGLDNTVTGDPDDIPFSIVKIDGETVLIADKDITVAEDLGEKGKAYEFSASADVAQEITDKGFIIKPKTDKNVAVAAIEVEMAKAPAAVDIEISPESGDIAAALATAVEGKNVGKIQINLTAGGEYTIGSAMVAPGAFTIRGNGATVNVAAEFTGEAIVKMAASAEAPTAVTKVDYISFHDVTFKGLSKALFYSTQKKYDIEWFTVENCVLELTADATTIDFTKGSAARNINVVNSTIYAPTATTKSFYSSQSGEKMTEIDAAGIQTFIFKNNTMYNLAKAKNFFTHRQNNQKWLAYDVENNIFVNCGKSGQVIKGMNGGQGGSNPTWTIIGNAFNYDGADTSANEETGDADHTGDETPGQNETVQNSVAGVVTFTNAANGDFNGVFTLAEGAEEPATKPGDPRWTITYATPVEITTMSIVGEFTGGWPVQDPETSVWDWSMAKAMTQDAENANIWTLEMPFVAEAKKYEYKAAANSNWNDYVLPAGDNANFIFGTPEYPAGEYILTFTADTKNHTVGVVAKWNGPEDIKVVPEEGSDISTAVQTASEGKKVKDIYVYLAPGKKFTISKSIVAPAAFVFMGAEEGTNPSDIDENATMAEIDASALDGPMVLMSETPAVAADANGFYPLADVGFLNVKVTGLAHQLFYANKQKYLINCFHVDFCNINIAGGSKTIIDTNSGGVIATLDMSKNTIWANPENTGALYSSQSGDKATAAGLAVQTFNIEKNTMYNIAKGKNFCSHRQSNQTWLTYNVKNNTFVNCGKSGQVIKGLNGGSGGANPTWNVDGNAFNFDGADTSANEETGDADEPVKNSLAGVFTFTDATAGDFNGVFKSDAAEAPAKYPGDPRWTYTYESTAPAKFYLIGSMNGWDRTALTEMTFNETTQAYEYEYAPTEKVWFAFADKQLTADEAAADPEWADFNANHRYAIGSGDVNATLNEAIALQKINGTLVLGAGSYKISVAKDLSTVTITGEAPETTYTVAGSFYYAEGSVAIFGTEWDASNTANDMEKQLDGTYKKVYTIDFPYAGNIQFKVVEDHAWDVSYGWDVTAENPDGNAFYAVASPATGATVTITFDPNGATAADKVKIEVTGIPTVGISGIATDDADDNAPIYNLAGQKVTKSYKGVVIKNGKKIYQK